ncbi:MAG: hypothetical protein NC337_00065 [Roseburia sp.]|nr:hypothetical protein [Roseburia sp.]
MFKEELSASVGKILTENGYKMTVASGACIYFIKRYSDVLAFYVRCRDKRKHGGGIKIEFFFMPIVIPNDEVFSSGAGICIQVFPDGNCEGDVMLSAGRKLIAIERNMNKFSPVILKELETPFFPNGKIRVDTRTFLIYNSIEKDENVRQEFRALKKDVCRLMKNKNTKEACQLCRDFMKRLPAVYFGGKGLGINPDIDSMRFAEQIYAQRMAGA